MIFEPYLSIDLAVQVEPLAVEARELQRHLCVGGYSWMDGPCGLSNKIPRMAQFTKHFEGHKKSRQRGGRVGEPGRGQLGVVRVGSAMGVNDLNRL